MVRRVVRERHVWCQLMPVFLIFVDHFRKNQVHVDLSERSSSGCLLEFALMCAWTLSITVALNAPSPKQYHVGPSPPPISHLHHPVLRLLDAHVACSIPRMQVLMQRGSRESETNNCLQRTWSIVPKKFLYKMPSCNCKASH